MPLKSVSKKKQRPRRSYVPRSERVAPSRSIAAWADEALIAFDDPAVSRNHLAKIARYTSMRERRPESMVAIARKSSAALGVDVGQWVRMAAGSPGLLAVNADKVRRQLAELRKILGVSKERANQMARSNARLLTAGKGLLSTRMPLAARAAGLSLPRWRHCAKQRTSMLFLSPHVIAAHMKALQKIFGLDQAGCADLAVRDIRLLQFKPKRIADFIAATASDWGISQVEMRWIVIRSPDIATQNLSGRLSKSIDTLSKGLDVDRARVIAAARRYTPLVCRLNAERVVASVNRATELLQADRAVLVDAILRAPSLIGRRLEGMGKRMRLIRRIATARGLTLSANDVLTRMPAAMTYGMDRLLQRYIVMRLGLWPWNWETLLSYKDELIRKRLSDYFRAHPEQRSLEQAMQKRGLV